MRTSSWDFQRVSVFVSRICILFLAVVVIFQPVSASSIELRGERTTFSSQHAPISDVLLSLVTSGNLTTTYHTTYIGFNVVNTGTGAASKFELTAEIPDSLEVVSVGQSHGFCSLVGNTVSCLASINTLWNPDAEEGELTGWELYDSGLGLWTISSDNPLNGDYSFEIIDKYNERSQTIDLLDMGCSEAFLDAMPVIYVGEYVRGNGACYSDHYFINVYLLDEFENIIDQWSAGLPGSLMRTVADWSEINHRFENYGAGVRFIRFEDGGEPGELYEVSDLQGPSFDDAYVLIEGASLQPGTDVSVSLLVNFLAGGESIVNVGASAVDSFDHRVTISDSSSVTYIRPSDNTSDDGFSDSSSNGYSNSSL